MPDCKYFYHTISSWSQLIQEYNQLYPAQSDTKPTQWIFRGLKDCSFDLQTTLEREMVRLWQTDEEVKKLEESRRGERLEIYRNILRRTIPGGGQVFQLEKGLIRKFKRHSNHNMATTPDQGKTLEWLALMRHYGAPSRLLDFTYSFFVAVFFALEDANVSKDCVVWALDTDWMRKVVESGCLGKYTQFVWNCSLKPDETVSNQKTFEKVFGRPGRPMVFAVNPERLNVRLTLQKGIFLCPTDISVSFEENLDALFKIDKSAEHFKGYKISGNQDARGEILRHLQRMNIGNDTLFPGLDGFGKSLKTLLRLPELIAS